MKICKEHISKDFPFGSAIASAILENLPYQKIGNRINGKETGLLRDSMQQSLKTNQVREQGKVNYTIEDQMLEFFRANHIIARGHNIFLGRPQYNPGWVSYRSSTKISSRLTDSKLNEQIPRRKIIHWDVSNEVLHFDFYEQRLGPDAILNFYQIACEADPLATLFLNEFKVVETCIDVNAAVDTYIAQIRELESEGPSNEWNWPGELDTGYKFDTETQAIYLEQALKEGFSSPAVARIMLWTALHPNGFYQMCLKDHNLQNLLAAAKRMEKREIIGRTDDHGSYSFLGEYKVRVQYDNRTANST
ncbi:hypothetical protein SADUNF_Sadunf09G0108400 [Salix dunnii]|uniref:GH10 domain-containing protein n=1 Tax=Salix dunnii TaxID=1413687 RepID=A0A835JVT8_9ROSI|nr:hypothetical protein SADUNF_Sadunf09G0108400 [Salix dunnii]